MATVYDVIQGINQAAANAHDGAHVEKYSHDGKARKVGLKREEGDCIIDSRVMDGFSVRFDSSNRLHLSYQTEITMKDFHDNNFEDDVKSTINDVVKYLKKEYKDITGNTLSLTSDGDPDIHAQSMSRKRNWVQATQSYTIGGIKAEPELPSEDDTEDRVRSAIKDWLNLGREKAKKPKNVETSSKD
tara:strand:+ start:2643 stop:3203 length:561 start_codon:yes stop_codon:yes gene_type:complete